MGVVPRNLLSVAMALALATLGLVGLPSLAVADSAPVSIGTVHGAFYSNPNNSGGLDLSNLATPAFTQDFPVVDFNPPAAAQVSCSNSTGITENSRPFTDVVPQPDGTCSADPAQGVGGSNGLTVEQAGLNDLYTFQAIFTANLTVAAQGQVTFNFFSDDGWMLGAGQRQGGTEKPNYVSGSLVNPLSTTPGKSLQIVGSYNIPSAPAQNQVTVNFPAAGIYPIEVDYTECCGGQLALVLGTTFGNPIPPSASSLVAITSVTPANGSVNVSWKLIGTPPSPITAYVVSASADPSDNNRSPSPSVLAATVIVPPSQLSATLSGLIEDCHQVYSISVTPLMGGTAGAAAVWKDLVRPSGVVVPQEPRQVLILIDGINESKPGFQMDPYNPKPAGAASPSFCPQAWSPTTHQWLDNDFPAAPLGPQEFFRKWNFAAPSESSDSTPHDYATGILTNAFMLDAIAAQGAVLLPYSYKGATLSNSGLPGTDPVFTFPAYTNCNSTPKGVPVIDACITSSGPAGDRQSIDQDVVMLEKEIASVGAVWPDAKIVVVGHSQGGLIAFEWWLKHGAHHSARSGVTNLFSLDSPINGVCFFGVPCLGPESYPNYNMRDIFGKIFLRFDAKDGNPFRFLGTWGEKVPGYGGGNDTLQRQLLVTGSQCGDNTDNSDCPGPPDHISACPILDNSPAWVQGSNSYHFVVKWCPDDVSYFNNVLGLIY